MGNCFIAYLHGNYHCSYKRDIIFGALASTSTVPQDPASTALTVVDLSNGIRNHPRDFRTAATIPEITTTAAVTSMTGSHAVPVSPNPVPDFVTVPRAPSTEVEPELALDSNEDEHHDNKDDGNDNEVDKDDNENDSGYEGEIQDSQPMQVDWDSEINRASDDVWTFLSQKQGDGVHDLLFGKQHYSVHDLLFGKHETEDLRRILELDQ